MKTVEELFSKSIDSKSSIKELFVKEVKFSKKKNAAHIWIIVDRRINPLDIKKFEVDTAGAFSITEVKVFTKYESQKIDISNQDVINILEYIKSIDTYIGPMIKGSSINIDDEKITIILENSHSKFLLLKKLDKQIENLIHDFYGVEISVQIIDSAVAKEIEKEERKNIKTHVKVEEIVNSDEKRYGAEGINKPESNSGKTNNGGSVPKDIASKTNTFAFNRKTSKEVAMKIENVSQDDGKVLISGKVISVEKREIKSGKLIISIDVYDETSTITCKSFIDPKEEKELMQFVKEGKYIKVTGRAQYDMYAKELVIMISNIEEGITPKEKKDTADIKRCELHAHTQMSAMDAISSAKDLVNNAIKWGHKAIAITDHGVAQSFPEAYGAAYDYETKSNKIKVIYGVEAYLMPDVDVDIEKSETFVVFDIETTGFTAGTDKITEIGAVKIKDGIVVEEFSTFVNPERPIPKEVQELTHITPAMVKDSETIREVLPKFLEFCEGSIVVAHNAKFDLSFINYHADEFNLEKPKYTIDTLSMARELFESYQNHKLGTVAANLEIELEGAHRAINDAIATAKVFNKMCDIVKERNMNIYGYITDSDKADHKKNSTNHIIILVKNMVGLKNLYKLISFSHLMYFHKKPRMPRSVINRYREGLILGTACERGELYQAIINKQSEEEMEKIARYYDYLEIQPLGNNNFYIEKGILKDKQDLIDINLKIIELGKKLGKPVVATGDVHFLKDTDEIYRRIIMKGLGYEDADNQAPLYFRTTEEMLNEFDYLDEETRNDVVVNNTNLIADWIEEIKPVPSGTFNPVIPGSDEEIEELTYKRARDIYGDVLPEIVEARIKKELNSIISNGFSVMYLIAQKLVHKSNEDGYLVGSRGSVGSSFVATMTGITEVNPLPPHYICKNCKHSEFSDEVVTTGVDMVDKDCPKCGAKMFKEGMDIPFETFLGFKGDKVPDIDLNFSGEYQAKAHAYTEELFGKSKTFRAGTISTLADKTAYGFVKKYYEDKSGTIRNAEISRLTKGCTGIKKTTGQHPGGIIVVPGDKDIYDFCPVQRPADDVTTKTITTHFDFHSIHDNLLKLDILGHDDPTAIKMLEDITGVDAKTIALDEPKVMSLFSSTQALGVTPQQINSKTGTYAVPEFGTKFVRDMLMDTKPKTFGELVRISGLSHGTDVWLGNAQTLIQEGKATLKETICTRDDIMIYLIHKGMDPKLSFTIMEIVRKGKATKLLTEEMVEDMRKNNVPEWYIDSCKKIKYMFPKAHAAAYVMMAYRIAYFKVYYPQAFYATYYTVRADNFSSDLMCHGKKKAKESIKEYEQIQKPSQTEKDTITILEVVNEMLERGIEFLPVDIYLSDAKKFLVEGDKVRPPISALSGFGQVNAISLVKARQNGKFSSKENLQMRAKVGKTGLEILEKNKCIDNMPDSSQVNMFDM